MTQTTIDILSKYLALGWRLMPCHSLSKAGCSCGRKDCHAPGKHPRTRNGVLDASNARIDVIEWIQRFPDCNWAVATGNGMVVLDVDPRNDGDNSIRELQMEHGDIPETYVQSTGGGGLHYVFAVNGPVACGIVAEGIDLKGDGGYILVEPSNHKSGGVYKWTHLEGEPAPLPSWVEVRIPPPKPEVEKTADYFLSEVFKELGGLKEHLGNGKWSVRCPWEHTHTGQVSATRDSSTVILPPRAGDTVGLFRCQHAHCAAKSNRDVLRLRKKPTTTAAQMLAEPLASCNMSMLITKLSNGIAVPEPLSVNVAKIAAADDWDGILFFDAMQCCMVAMKPPPFSRPWAAEYPSRWTDADDRATTSWLSEGTWASRWTTNVVSEGLQMVADANRIDNLSDYLLGLRWDGVPRLDTWLSTYLGADNTEFNSFAGRKWMISAIARALKPGCQVDHILVLEGAQGAGKSKAFRILGGEYFTDDIGDIRGKDSAERIRGKWIVEDSELSALKRVDSGAAKSFITRTVDCFREAYGRRSGDFPRRCVFGGSVNDLFYLKDPTGARRFWCVSIDRCNEDDLRADRDQLWGEAVFAFQEGEAWWPITDVERGMCTSAAEERFSRDPWEPIIYGVIKGKSEFFGLNEIYQALSIPQAQRTSEMERRIVDILQRLKYKPVEGKWVR